MTKENQKKLYDHFMNLAENGKDDIQKQNCLRYAKDILKSFPDFDKKEDEEKPAEDDKPSEDAPKSELDKENSEGAK